MPFPRAIADAQNDALQAALYAAQVDLETILREMPHPSEAHLLGLTPADAARIVRELETARDAIKRADNLTVPDRTTAPTSESLHQDAR